MNGYAMDTLQIRVGKPDQGNFILMYLHPFDEEWIKSGLLVSGCTADEMKEGI